MDLKFSSTANISFWFSVAYRLLPVLCMPVLLAAWK
jgi:hypothetical protein